MMWCLDTYALIEVEKKNPQFAFLLEEEFVIADATLAEFYMIERKRFGEKTADYWLRQLSARAQRISLSVWLKAVVFRHEKRTERLSVYDCLGYCFALENGYTFVTGDKAFKGKKGVKFLK